MQNQYNGWANWETYNVALWISNDDFIYDCFRKVVKAILRPCEGSGCQNACCLVTLYDLVILLLDLTTKTTPDSVPFSSHLLDRKSLNELLRGMAE